MTLAVAVPADLIKETSTTTGTGAYALAGAVSGFLTFGSFFPDGKRMPYVAVDGVGGYEIGTGTWNSSGNTLSRTHVWRSSNANAAVSWAAGSRTIFCGQSALGSALTVQKHNLVATTSPGTGDDNTGGYDVGSLWFNLTVGRMYICLDAATGAALWRRVAATPVGGTNNSPIDSNEIIGGGTNTIGTSVINSVITGGTGNTINNSAADCGITGSSNSSVDASSVKCNVFGGEGHQVGGTYSTVFGGYTNTVNAYDGTIAGGRHNSVTADDSYVTGVFGSAIHESGRVHGGGNSGVSVAGTFQFEDIVLTAATTDATVTQTQVNGNPSFLLMPANSTWLLTADIAAYDSANNLSSSWTLKACYKRSGSGTPALVGSAAGGTAFAQDGGASTWAVAFAVDSGNTGIKLNVTGAAAHNIHWTAAVRLSQVID